MEYVPCGDLGKVIAQYEKLDEETVQVIASQLLSALKYLHKMGITHRDVKPDNILIQNQDPLHVKLTDFGLSKMIGDNDDTFLQTFCGTLLYCAPEVYTEYREYGPDGNRTRRPRDKKAIKQPRYDQAVDLWSLGSVLFYALCGSPPYPAKTGITYQDLLRTIMTKALDIRPIQNAGVSDAGINFLRSMLRVQPDRRATIQELEASAWLANRGSAATSIDEDEIDFICDPNNETLDPTLEESASQLSLHEPSGGEINNAAAQGVKLAYPLVNEGQREILNSETGDSFASESFAFIRNSPGNNRLFGEVNASALGSSGVIPEGRLNLPVSGSVSQSGNFETSREPNYTTSVAEPRSASDTMEGVDYTQTQMTNDSNATTDHDPVQSHLAFDYANAADAAPSLFGAESMVGQMQMNSPSPVTNPELTGPPTPNFQASVTTSLRRPHDGDETEVLEDSRPPFKRAKSTREIDMPISKTIFWNERDKSTWHHDYPDMLLSQYTQALDVAQAHGERFVHGEKIFEKYMGSFRKTPSVEPEEKPRAQSEPTIEQGRKAMMKRDERKLEDPTDANLLVTARGQSMIVPTHHDTHVNDQSSPATVIPLVNKGNSTFKHPKRPLAKFLATSDSVLHSLNLTITDSFTSWGRGGSNTIIHPNHEEARIPKYSFKLVLWKKGLSATSDQSPEQDQSFWISTKASMGILINGMLLKSHDSKHPETASKEWGELRNGDEIMFWINGHKPSVFLKLRFECHFGASKVQRPTGSSPFDIMTSGEISDELDQFCLQKEQDFKLTSEKAEADRREQRIKAKMEKEKEKETETKDKENAVQSFIPAPLLTD
jgi:serine/threonine protein kinase